MYKGDNWPKPLFHTILQLIIQKNDPYHTSSLQLNMGII